MAATSVKQRRLMGMAYGNPSKLYKKNRGVLSMGKTELRKFAKTKEKNLPYKKG